MRVVAVGHRLRLIDLASGKPLLRPDEEADAHRAEAAARQAEAAARRAAEQQLLQSEQRAEKLAARLRELGIDPETV
jgi:transcription elongation GreA/GreB family factor